MSYLPDFKYDVFMSYAHIDNKTTDDEEFGWITKFYHRFKLELDRYLEGTNTAEIWCDHELRKNYAFDDRIQNVIDTSAIFLAFTSNGFYRSEYCCDKELNFFYKKALDSKIGIKVNDCRRVFNIQLLNKPYQNWPVPLQGGGKYAMYKYSNTRSIKKDEDPGITLDADLDRKEYDKSIIEIVLDVCNTLKTIKEKTITATPDPDSSVNRKIFVGKVADTLMPVRNQIINALTSEGITVDNEKIPPPYDRGEHQALVERKIADSVLSIHLYDGIAGDKISNDYPYSFSQEQLLIGKRLNKEQLIFIPQELDFDTIEDSEHSKFLSGLLTKKETSAKYSLVRELSVPVIIDLIKDKVNKPKPVTIYEGSILLDYNEADTRNAVDYYNSLLSENKKIYLTPPGSGPMEVINKYANALEEVTTVIIVCFTVAKDWLIERIKEIIRAIQTGKSRITKLSVYGETGIEDLNLADLKKIF